KNLILLSLLENNFQEFLNTRPLFEMVNEGLDDKDKEKLHRLAVHVAEAQELRLGAALVPPIHFVTTQTKNIQVGDLKLSMTLPYRTKNLRHRRALPRLSSPLKMPLLPTIWTAPF